MKQGDRLFKIINTLFLILIVAVVLYPLYFVVIASVSEPRLVTAGKVFAVPAGLNLDGYRKVFENHDIWTGYKNAIVYTVVGTAVCLGCTIPAAFVLSRRDLPGNKLFMGLITFTMFFNGGLVPSFLLVNNLGLYDSMWAVTLPFAVNVYNLIVARTFMGSSIPLELYEAAQLDGSSDFQFFFRIVLFLSKPIISVLVLLYAVEFWNSYFYSLIYLQSRDKFPLQVILRELLIQADMASSIGGDSTMMQLQELAETLKYSVIIVSSLPMMILYPFVEKYFEKGMMIGSVKG
ncbi:MAG TPA: carbohydrate ABC transporter permease [Candidatus Eisenbergiella merdavium]|uniref:Carbohydrate ABC transporter permease n=1 Tax=Candidatus Eisenbergiella merdavium TaxID=2838551 RepID=A0A9D2NGV8_9FIRM|nr:carbohydrate ABC transporter permease [Candidatus Eisenbergiella merdavium]